MGRVRLLHTAGKVLKYGSLATLVGSSATVLHHNNWDVSSVGAVRFGRAAVAAVKVVADYKITLRGMNPETEDYRKMRSKVHTRSAERLRDMCCVNGGCFIKVGQHIGALEYLLPKEYVDVMKVLHSDAPKTPVEDLYTVIKEDLGKEVDEIFINMEDKPLGAASLAQVHKATLKDGRVVAVKVQHPKVKAHSFVDIATMELLVRAVAWVFPEFQFMWLAEETKKNLPLELDFVHEAKNCERVSKMFSKCNFLKVPEIHWDLTTERVLTMEYCEGGQVNDKQYYETHNISVDDVSRKLGTLYSEMIFVQGYIHCDPHPGNVLVNKVDDGDTQIVLLDHGLYQTLTDEFRLNYCGLWQSILNTNIDGIKEYAERMGIGRLFPLFACMVTARSWKAVSAGVDRHSFTPEEDAEIKASASQYLPEISEILNQIPRQMLLILKANDLLRGIETTLKTRASARSFLTMSKCCVRALAEHNRKLCHSWVCRLKLTVREQWMLLGLGVYEFFLWFKGTSFVRFFRGEDTNGNGNGRTSVAEMLASS